MSPLGPGALGVRLSSRHADVGCCRRGAEGNRDRRQGARGRGRWPGCPAGGAPRARRCGGGLGRAAGRGAGAGGPGGACAGRGPPVGGAGQPREHPRVFDGRSYWLAEQALDKQAARSACVIGSGETAASIVISLLSKSHKHSTVDVVTSRGVLYSRGESYDENRFYSDPGDWPQLAESHRREFLERTDRGVFSAQAEAILNQSHGFRTLAGRALRIEAGERQGVVTLGDGRERERGAHDPLVVASGFQARWFGGLRGGEAVRPRG